MLRVSLDSQTSLVQVYNLQTSDDYIPRTLLRGYRIHSILALITLHCAQASDILLVDWFLLRFFAEYK